MSIICRIARRSLQHYLVNRRIWKPMHRFGFSAGCFVSLHTDQGELRGCIGTIEPTKPDLALEIADNAVSAGTRDTRFPTITPQELDELAFEVSVLHPPKKIDGPGQLDPKRFGVVVEQGWKRGVLLPDLPGVDTVAQQIAIAETKAGIVPGESVKILRFEVEKHHE